VIGTGLENTIPVITKKVTTEESTLIKTILVFAPSFILGKSGFIYKVSFLILLKAKFLSNGFYFGLFLANKSANSFCAFSSFGLITTWQ